MIPLIWDIARARRPFIFLAFTPMFRKIFCGLGVDAPRGGGGGGSGLCGGADAVRATGCVWVLLGRLSVGGGLLWRGVGTIPMPCIESGIRVRMSRLRFDSLLVGSGGGLYRHEKNGRYSQSWCISDICVRARRRRRPTGWWAFCFLRLGPWDSLPFRALLWALY